MSTMPLPQPTVNPALFGWAGQNVNQTNSPLPSTNPIQGPPQGPWGNPGNLPNPTTNQKDQIRNAGLLGVQQGQLRNDLIPQFANLMMGYGGSAADFFNTLKNLGSPFYQQKQSAAFGQGVQQNQNAAALARQQLAAQGYGATPSGATAALIGGMNVEGGKSLSEQFLEQLFQNEQLQLGGAQGLAQLAALFNPSSLFGSTGPTGQTQGPSAADSFAAIMGALGIGGKAGPVTFGGK